VAPQAIIHFERATGRKRLAVGAQAEIEIIGMHVLGPAVADFLFESAPNKVEPRFVEPCAIATGARNPQQNRCGIGHVTETRFAFVQLFQSAHAFGHVFHSCDGKLRLALGIAHHKHGQVTPQGVALLVDEALVQTIVIELAGQQTVIQIDIGAVIVRVRDVVARQLSQFIGAVAHHLLKARIWLDELSLQVFDNNAQCRMLENTAKAGFALLHGALIALLLGDVDRVSHDAQHFASVVAHNAARSHT
jgi:hypothetical protein